MALCGERRPPGAIEVPHRAVGREAQATIPRPQLLLSFAPLECGSASKLDPVKSKRK